MVLSGVYARIGSRLLLKGESARFYGFIQFRECGLLAHELVCPHSHKTRDAAVNCATKALGKISKAAERPVEDG